MSRQGREKMSFGVSISSVPFDKFSVCFSYQNSTLKWVILVLVNYFFCQHLQARAEFVLIIKMACSSYRPEYTFTIISCEVGITVQLRYSMTTPVRDRLGAG